MDCFGTAYFVLFGYFVSHVSTCDVYLTATETPAFLTSPNYPRNYSNNVDCWWRIQASGITHHVIIDMIQFDLEQTRDCNADYLLVYEGIINIGAPRKRLCGTTRWLMVSRGNAFYLVFRSDGSDVRVGFKIKYYSNPNKRLCGGDLEATSDYKELTSPGYPNDYYDDLNCHWLLSASGWGYKVEVEVLDLEMESDPSSFSIFSSSSSCSYDYLRFYNGNNTVYSNIVGTYCSGERPSLTSSDNMLKVVLVTDDSNGKKGFRLRYRSSFGLLGAVLGGVGGAAVIIAVIICIVCRAKRKARRPPATPNPQVNVFALSPRGVVPNSATPGSYGGAYGAPQTNVGSGFVTPQTNYTYSPSVPQVNSSPPHPSFPQPAGNTATPGIWHNHPAYAPNTQGANHPAYAPNTQGVNYGQGGEFAGTPGPTQYPTPSAPTMSQEEAEVASAPPPPAYHDVVKADGGFGAPPSAKHLEAGE